MFAVPAGDGGWFRNLAGVDVNPVLLRNNYAISRSDSGIAGRQVSNFAHVIGYRSLACPNYWRDCPSAHALSGKQLDHILTIIACRPILSMVSVFRTAS